MSEKLKIEKYDLVHDQELAQLNQRRMILSLYKTETWLLLENTFKQLERNYRAEKQKLINGTTVQVKEKVLYVEGKQDAIHEILDAIQKIVADGETILMKNKLIEGTGEDY